MFGYINEDEKLQKAIYVFNSAKKKSTFYKEKYKNTGSIKNLNDWLAVPFLNRSELFSNSFPKSLDMLTKPIENMIVTSTGGSSGIARYGILTYSEWDEFVNKQAEALKLIGITQKDIVANLFVAGSLWPSFLGAHEAVKNIGAVHLPISANIEIDKILKFLVEFKPTVLLSLPTVFVFLADKIIQNRIKIDSIRLMCYGGEHMSNNIRKHLKRAFGNVSINALAYTSADCGLMGYQCSECLPKEYHAPSDFQFIEIYNFDENRLCKQGEKGEIVVTNLSRFSFPIIRYRIGDAAKWKGNSCLCGDKNPVFTLEGRTGDDFKLGGAYISMDDIERSVADFISLDGISANYLLEIEDVNENKMNITLKMESSDIESSQKHIKDIKNNLRNNIEEISVGERLDYIKLYVSFVELGNLPRSPITGKVKHLNDKRVEV